MILGYTRSGMLLGLKGHRSEFENEKIFEEQSKWKIIFLQCVKCLGA